MLSWNTPEYFDGDMAAATASDSIEKRTSVCSWELLPFQILNQGMKAQTKGINRRIAVAVGLTSPYTNPS